MNRVLIPVGTVEISNMVTVVMTFSTEYLLRMCWQLADNGGAGGTAPRSDGAADSGAAEDSDETANRGAAVDACRKGLATRVGVVGVGTSVVGSDAGSDNGTVSGAGAGESGSAGGVCGSGSSEAESSAKILGGAVGASCATA
jgi:hypothetical protein